MLSVVEGPPSERVNVVVLDVLLGFDGVTVDKAAHALSLEDSRLLGVGYLTHDPIIGR
jgi:hypothetical protein